MVVAQEFCKAKRPSKIPVPQSPLIVSNLQIFVLLYIVANNDVASILTMP